MAKRIAEIWFALLVLILMAGMVAAQERLSQADTKAPPTYQEPSGHAAVLYEEAGEFMKGEDYTKAAEAFKQITRLRPEDSFAYNGLGCAYMALGNDREALIAFKEAVRLRPDIATSHSALGELYSKLGRYQEAIEAFKEAVRLRPDRASSHSDLGKLYSKLGRHQEAIEAFKQAIRINPDFFDAYMGLGIAYDQLGSYLGHRGQYEQYEKVMELWKEAGAAYKQAVRLKPDDARAHLGLGMSYLLQGDRGAALEEYKILQTLDKERANVLFNSIYK